MYLRMAVHASSPLEDRGAIPAQDVGRRRLTGQQRLNGTMRRVACLAEVGRPSLQQAVRRGSMRVMADRAVLIDRFVTMHEWAAFLHVAGVTGFIHAILLHELRTHRTMYIVAIGASHLSLNNWMMRRLVDLATLLLVATKADFRLSAFIAHLILPTMHRVAGSTRHVGSIMRAAHPMRTLRIFIVTTQAGGGALDNRRKGLLVERAVGLNLAGIFHVAFTLAMASNASRRAAIGLRTMLGLADRQNLFVIVMAFRAFVLGRECRTAADHANDHGI